MEYSTNSVKQYMNDEFSPSNIFFRYFVSESSSAFEVTRLNWENKMERKKNIRGRSQPRKTRKKLKEKLATHTRNGPGERERERKANNSALQIGRDLRRPACKSLSVGVKAVGDIVGDLFPFSQCLSFFLSVSSTKTAPVKKKKKRGETNPSTTSTSTSTTTTTLLEKKAAFGH